MDVEVVASGGPSEQCEGLVGGELAVGDRRSERGLPNWPEPSVVPEVNLAPLVTSGHLEPDEPRCVPEPGHRQPGGRRCRLERRSKPVDGDALAAEEVETAGVAVDDPEGDQGSATGESESLGLRQPGEEAGDVLLESAQQASRTPRRRRRWTAQA